MPASQAAPAAEAWRREKRLVVDLKPHPLQGKYFRDMTDAALHDLAENIRRRGLRRPIEILPNGTIVSGHQRLRAVKLLG
jgi:ParB-like chromosome segregation protein Spo0J